VILKLNGEKWSHSVIHDNIMKNARSGLCALISKDVIEQSKRFMMAGRLTQCICAMCLGSAIIISVRLTKSVISGRNVSLKTIFDESMHDIKMLIIFCMLFTAADKITLGMKK